MTPLPIVVVNTHSGQQKAFAAVGVPVVGHRMTWVDESGKVTHMIVAEVSWRAVRNSLNNCPFELRHFEALIPFVYLVQSSS